MPREIRRTSIRSKLSSSMMPFSTLYATLTLTLTLTLLSNLMMPFSTLYATHHPRLRPVAAALSSGHPAPVALLSSPSAAASPSGCSTSASTHTPHRTAHPRRQMYHLYTGHRILPKQSRAHRDDAQRGQIAPRRLAGRPRRDEPEGSQDAPLDRHAASRPLLADPAYPPAALMATPCGSLIVSAPTRSTPPTPPLAPRPKINSPLSVTSLPTLRGSLHSGSATTRAHPRPPPRPARVLQVR